MLYMWLSFHFRQKRDMYAVFQYCVLQTAVYLVLVSLPDDEASRLQSHHMDQDRAWG